MDIVPHPRYSTETVDGVALTPRQLDCFHAIEEHWRQHLSAPTVRELCDGLGIRIQAVCDLLTALRRRGLVEHLSGRHCAIRTARTQVRHANGGTYIFWENTPQNGEKEER